MHRDSIAKVNEILGCAEGCKQEVCDAFGLQPNCTLFHIPNAYVGKYWYPFQSPASIAGYWAETWLLQAASGLEFAWGQLSFEELEQLSMMHRQQLATI